MNYRKLDLDSEYIVGYQKINGVYCEVVRKKLIRCKDCERWIIEYDTGRAICSLTKMGQPETGYCNWAFKSGS